MFLFVNHDAMENVELLTSVSSRQLPNHTAPRRQRSPCTLPKIRENANVTKYFQAYKCKKICNLITQTTGRSGSSIAYFWKSRVLVTLAKITYSNALRWETAHNKSNKDPDSMPIDFSDCYDDDTRET